MPGRTIEFRLLGPLDARGEGGSLPLGPAKQRALLALLLLNRNRALSRERIIDDLWGEAVPATAAKMVQIQVSGLRKVLPGEMLVTKGSGYALDVEAGSLDLDRFEQLAAEGRAALGRGDAERGGQLLGEALALWRGTALEEFEEPFARSERPRLEEMRLAALEDRIEADLRAGSHAGLVAELDALAERHPLRERVRAQQMLALYRSGRQADALAAYRRGRRVLDAELGLQPSAELRELERRILVQDPELAAPPAARDSGRPATQYVINDGASIGYQVFGDGPVELALVTGWVLPIELLWDEPRSARFLERLGSFARVVIWDKRGTGVSDRLPPGAAPTLDERMGDLLAVIDAAGFDRPALFGISEGTALSVLLAATHPDRVRALVVYGGWAVAVRADDHPWGATPEAFAEFVERVRDGWGRPEALVPLWAPSHRDDDLFLAWWGRALRLGASPTTAARWLHLASDTDVRDALPALSVPALVLHRAEDKVIPVQCGRYLGERIPGADYVELPGEDHLWWAGEQEDVLGPVERFLTGDPRPPVTRRLLTTVLCAHVGASPAVRAELERFEGRPVRRAGDAVLASFDGPTRAIRCATAIRDALGERMRAGLHTGEVDLDGEAMSGLAVDLAERIGAVAAPGEVLVSRTVSDLVAGSGIAFGDRGEQRLGDVRLPLLAVVG